MYSSKMCLTRSKSSSLSARLINLMISSVKILWMPELTKRLFVVFLKPSLSAVISWTLEQIFTKVSRFINSSVNIDRRNSIAGSRFREVNVSLDTDPPPLMVGRFRKTRMTGRNFMTSILKIYAIQKVVWFGSPCVSNSLKLNVSCLHWYKWNGWIFQRYLQNV